MDDLDFLCTEEDPDLSFIENKRNRVNCKVKMILDRVVAIEKHVREEGIINIPTSQEAIAAVDRTYQAFTDAVTKGK